MIISPKCIELIKLSEGFSATPYLCPAGIPTIGFGSTRDLDGKPITMSHKTITEQEAYNLMMSTLEHSYAPAVNRYVMVSITQGMFDALVDFAYNLGVKALQSSTLLRLLNSGDTLGASKEFKKWVHANGKVQKGLVIRRERERLLFLS